MIGQWIGEFKGNNNNDGFVTLNLEMADNNYKGEAILLSNIPTLPHLHADISISAQKRDSNKFKGELSNFSPINPITLSPIMRNEEWLVIRQAYPNAILPKNGKIQGTINNETINGEWKTDISSSGTFKADISRGQLSSCPSKNMSWGNFKKFISNLKNKKNYIFRGQSSPLKLRTSFHRAGRYNFKRYALEDVRILHKYICAETGRNFNLFDPKEHGALLYLAQHHGYPTPLLDWSHSPYIAAYFAFLKVNQDTNQNVKVFIFDKFSWNNDNPKVENINSPFLSLTLLDLLAIDNKRPIPQQSITMFSNVDDIERYINLLEIKNKKKYLQVIEIPISEKKEALDDLYQMGVTASALFPGIDGICQTLKEQCF